MREHEHKWRLCFGNICVFYQKLRKWARGDVKDCEVYKCPALLFIPHDKEIPPMEVAIHKRHR